MDCLEAQAILSAAHDGEHIEVADLAAAREHCSECPDCSAFADGLVKLDALPVPAAPPAAIDAALGAIHALAKERAEAERLAEAEFAVPEAMPGPEAAPIIEKAAAPAPEPRPDRPAHRFAWFNDSVKWASIGALGAVAVTALIAFIVVSSGTGTRTAESTGTPSTASGGAPDLTFGAGGSKAASATQTQPQTSAHATAPDYIVYKNLVYSPGALLADSTEATPAIGTVTTAFASGGAPASAQVFSSPLTDGSVVVKGPDGYRVYSPVVRLLASKRYQLEAGNAVDHFGIWPSLPSRFTPPMSGDGSPSFAAAGTDALGANIFAATGQSTASGFAVAPGTSSGDPAAGNPNWTWWTPVN